MSKSSRSDFSNPTADLLAAIEKLETFAEQNQSHAEPSLQDLNREEKAPPHLSDNPLEKTIHSVRSFFSSVFSEKTRLEQQKKKQRIKNDVLHAIEVVKSNFYLIQKYHEGTPEQQKIAASTLAAIDSYNQSILDERKNSATLRNRIERFLKGEERVEENLPKAIIDFPQPIVDHVEFPKKNDSAKRISHKFDCPTAHAASIKICSFIRPTIANSNERDARPNENERDGFIMKGITLIRDLGNTFGNAFPLGDLMKTIRGTPIHAVLQKSADGRQASGNATVSLRQVLIPFPGETIELTGEFKRESQCSFPIPHSFRLFSKSVQTGFPHPSQHSGWALADQLIPAYPQKMEQMPILQPLLQKKNAIAKALLPKGELREKAKAQLKLKKQGFETDKEELLNHLLELHLAILRASPRGLTEELKLTVQRFFDGLKQRANAYDELSETQHILLETFIRHPFEKLKSDWIERSSPGLLSGDPCLRYRSALSTLENEKMKRKQELLIQLQTLPTGFEKQAIEFILGMGEVLFPPCASIVLQHFSEIIHFLPPVLGEFEQKMQLCAYSQLHEFLHGIESNDQLSITSVKKQFIRQIQSDLKIFSGNGLDKSVHPLARIIHELEAYFNAQYAAKPHLLAS